MATCVYVLACSFCHIKSFVGALKTVLVTVAYVTISLYVCSYARDPWVDIQLWNYMLFDNANANF